MIRVGPAGWSYPEWEGRIYPRHKPAGFQPLTFLSRMFDTVEINASFYAIPKAEHAERWVKSVAHAPGFRFYAKLHRDFTHMPEPKDGERDEEWERRAAEFRAGIEPLVRARRLAGLLAQFPVSFLHGKSEVRRLGRLRSLFDDLPLILEVRHESWYAPPAIDQVRGLSYSLAYIDLPSAWNHPPPWHTPTGPIGYLRLHGRNSTTWFRDDAEHNDKYDYLYGAAEVEALTRKAQRIASLHAETAVITNNTYSGKAIATAVDILFALNAEPIAVPVEIVESFPHLASRTRIEGQQNLF